MKNKTNSHEILKIENKQSFNRFSGLLVNTRTGLLDCGHFQIVNDSDEIKDFVFCSVCSQNNPCNS